MDLILKEINVVVGFILMEITMGFWPMQAT